MRNPFAFILLFLCLISVNGQQKLIWLKIKRFHVADLERRLHENSGLAFLDGKLFSVNDSGNSAELFQLNKKNGAVARVWQTGLTNIDWEALTAGNDELYIGDIGNNSGSRKHLSVYRIKFGKDSIITRDSLQFYYPEQTDFSAPMLRTNFDSEALIFANGQLHLFTKEWLSKGTTHYIIDPKNSENQSAQKAEKYTTGFFVTDAAYFERKLYLVGYTKNTDVYLSVFSKSEQGIFFRNPPKKYYLGSAISISQIEAIAVDAEGIYLSGEGIDVPLLKIRPKFYFIPHAFLYQN